MLATLAPAVFLLSASVLAFEILLLRLFAIETFHHFAPMAIGIALLGSGASGALLVVVGPRVRGREPSAFATLAAATALAIVAAPPFAHGLIAGLDPDPGPRSGWLTWLALYVLLALPFLASGAAQAIALQAAAPRVGRVYAWNLLGSSAGTLLSLALLGAFTPARALSVAALPAVAAAALVAWPRMRQAAALRRAAPLAAAAGAVVLMAAVRPPWDPRVAEARSLSTLNPAPHAARLAEAWGPAGWVVAVDVPGFRHAPGLSRAFHGTVPRQIALLVDAQVVGAATVHGDEDRALEFLHWLPSAAAYAVRRTPESVLVIGAGEGLESLSALEHGAAHVTALERIRALPAAADASVAAGARTFADPRVDVVVADPRAYVASAAARFDVIAVPAVAGAAGTSGLHDAGEDYVNTVEAYEAYLRRLEPGGVLAITRWLRSPPSDNLEVILTAAAALERVHGRSAGRMLFVRSEETGTLLVKPDAFDAADVDRLRAFVEERAFVLDAPAGGEGLPPELDASTRPIYEHALVAASAGPRHAAAFAAAYDLDVAPATDDRPYLGNARRTGGERVSHGARSHDRAGGAMLATLGRGATIAAALLLLPLVALRRRRQPHPHGLARTAAYFAAIGIGFMFVEIAVLQRLSLVLGHPVYATALTVAAILAFSGAGSALSDRMPARAAHACVAIAVIAVAAAFALPWTRVITALPFAGRAAAALALIAVPGVLLGCPFPLGLRKLANGAEAIAWAWAANGIAAVVASSAATLIAMTYGGRTLIAAGAACYLLAAAVAYQAPAAAPSRTA